MDVAAWLDGLGLGQYGQAFRGRSRRVSLAGLDRASTTGAASPGRRRARRLVMLPERQSSRAGLEAVTRAAGAAIHASRLIFPRRDAMCVA